MQIYINISNTIPICFLKSMRLKVFIPLQVLIFEVKVRHILFPLTNYYDHIFRALVGCQFIVPKVLLTLRMAPQVPSVVVVLVAVCLWHQHCSRLPLRYWLFFYYLALSPTSFYLVIIL